MPRPKGAKNKTTAEKVEKIIEEVKELKGVDAQEVAQAVDELDDLLAGNTTELPTDSTDSQSTTLPENIPDVGKAPEEAKTPEADKTKVLIGYHPVTGKPVYQ